MMPSRSWVDPLIHVVQGRLDHHNCVWNKEKFHDFPNQNTTSYFIFYFWRKERIISWRNTDNYIGYKPWFFWIAFFSMSHSRSSVAASKWWRLICTTFRPFRFIAFLSGGSISRNYFCPYLITSWDTRRSCDFEPI